ncbi:MAG: RagB/SusD family nutrient uptake outer membrane protein [Rikenellaceae bacterium]
MKSINITIKQLLCILSVAIFTLSTSSCEEFSVGDSFLSQTPESVGIDVDEVFSSEYYASQVLTMAYTQLHYPIPYSGSGYDRLAGDMSDALTDLSHNGTNYGGAVNYYNGSYSASSTGDSSNYNFISSKTWTGIRYAWIVVENIDKVPDMTTAEKNQAKAEAKMLIATHYADMFRHFGGVPIIDHSLSTADELSFPRNTARETLDFIIELIDDATPYLEWRVSDSNDDGRMTGAYAQGLKLRTLLFAASPLFNSATPYMDGSDALTWLEGEDATLWEEAAQVGEDFFKTNADTYTLNESTGTTVTEYRKAFRDAYFTRANPEMILSIRRAYKNTYSSAFCGGSDNYAHKQGPTLKLFELYPWNSGDDFDFDWSNPAAANPFADRDPRFYETILNVNEPYKGYYSQLWVGGLEHESANESTGFKMYKFSQDYTTSTSIGQVDCYPAMRLPEVMLSYAEALNEVNSGPTDVAVQMVVDLRARVGLTYPSATDMKAYSQEEFRNFVLDERAREFAYEDVRWFDIVRWKMEDSFTTPVQGVNIYRTGSSVTPDATYSYVIYGNTAVDGSNVTITTARSWVTSWSPRWYLSAFPLDEVNKNYGLVQNPGW